MTQRGSTKVSSVLRDRDSAIGTWVQMNSPETCELAASSGFDFVIIDMEHGSFDLADAVHMIRAVECRDADAIVRTPSDDPTGIKKVLDAGAHGVLVPGIRSAEQARHVVAAARYEPTGARGACPCVRASDHGLLPWDDVRRWGDEEALVWLLIEHPQAVEEIEGIAAAGADAIALGPFDLAMSMGFGGDHHRPEVRDALSRVVATARGQNIDCVAVALEETPAKTSDVIRYWREQDCRIVTALLDRSTLMSSYRQMLTTIS